MGVEFKTLRELKEKLPEVLKEIKTLNTFADAERVLLDSQLKSACRVLVGYAQPSWFETDEAIQETYNNMLLHQTRAKWLQAQVEKVRNHPEI